MQKEQFYGRIVSIDFWSGLMNESIIDSGSSSKAGSLVKDFFEGLKGLFQTSPLMVIFSLLTAVTLLLLIFFLGRAIQKLLDRKSIAEERRDAVKRSRSVLGGQFSEQLAPYLPNFPCNPGDVRFIGKPIDYIAFPGSAEGESIKEVLFIEVKTGEALLSQREKEIKDAVLNGRVKYVEYHIQP